MKHLLVIAGMVFVILIIFGLPTMLLWNWLMPEIFGLPEITFWQAIGLNMLASILFKLNYQKSKE
jgi:hypothetical protein